MKQYITMTAPLQDKRAHPAPQKIGTETLCFWQKLHPTAPCVKDRTASGRFWGKPTVQWPEYFLHGLIAQEALTVMTSSAPTERLFSDAGQVLTEKRSRLEPDLLADLVFCGENLDCFRDKSTVGGTVVARLWT